MDIHQQLAARQSSRMKSEDRYLDRLEKKEEAAHKMVGTLIRNGKTINYIYPTNGRYREGSEQDLIAFLVRNQYV